MFFARPLLGTKRHPILQGRTNRGRGIAAGGEAVTDTTANTDLT